MTLMPLLNHRRVMHRVNYLIAQSYRLHFHYLRCPSASLTSDNATFLAPRALASATIERDTVSSRMGASFTESTLEYPGSSVGWLSWIIRRGAFKVRIFFCFCSMQHQVCCILYIAADGFEVVVSKLISWPEKAFHASTYYDFLVATPRLNPI